MSGEGSPLDPKPSIRRAQRTALLGNRRSARYRTDFRDYRLQDASRRVAVTESHTLAAKSARQGAIETDVADTPAARDL
jgi:hypothetical protein